MLRLQLKSSMQMALVLTLGYFLAAACLFWAPMPRWLMIVLLAALALNLLFLLRHQAWRAWPFSINALQFERDGLVIAQYRNGQLLQARVLASSFVAPYLTIVLLQPAGAWWVRSVVVVPDCLPAETFRRLRIWLKWRAGGGAAPPASIEWTGQL